MTFELSLPISQHLAAALAVQFSEGYVLTLFNAQDMHSLPVEEVPVARVFWDGLSAARLELAGASNSQLLLSVLCHLSELDSADTIDAFVQDVQRFGSAEAIEQFRSMTAGELVHFGREVGAIANICALYWHRLCVPEGTEELRGKIEKWGGIIGRPK